MKGVFGIQRKIRGTRRAAEVLAVLMRHGFRQIITDVGLAGLLARGQELLGRAAAADGVESQPVPFRVRRVLEELGPTFIKLGQILSTRPDLIPPEFAEEFKHLQADCPVVEYASIDARLRAEFGDRLETLFSHVEEEPLAAASMAQVHRATLQDGSRVVLKVLRPGIHRLINSDIDVLSELASLTERHFLELGYSPTAIVQEFGDELERELDLVHEGRATERFREQFVDDDRIVFPRVYWDSTTSNVLTLEEMQGRLLTSIDPKTMGTDERRSVVQAGADAVFRQCLEYGFFHADPHPGNLMVLDGNRLCFLDSGMTGRVDRATAYQLADLVKGVVDGEVNAVLDSMASLAGVSPALRRQRGFRNDVWHFIARFEGATLERLDMPGLLDAFFGLLRRYKVSCPPDLVILIKALTTIQGVGQALDPDLDLIEFARPHLERLMRGRYSAEAAQRRLREGLTRYMGLVEDLPAELREIVEQLRNHELTVNVQHRGVDRLNDDSLERASRTLAFGFVTGGLLVASAVLLLATQGGAPINWVKSLGAVGVIGAGGLMVLLTLTAVRRRRK